MFLLKKIEFYLFVKTRILKYILLSDNQIIGFKPRLVCPVLFSGEGKIILGNNVQFGYVQSALYYSHYGYIEARTKISRIEIGNNVVINNNFNIVSIEHIRIEDYCTIGINFSVIDSDFHHIDPMKRNAINPPSKSIKIGKNVFIGNNVTILKGVIIGDNVVIGNGSLVSSDIPANTIAAGNPARVIKML